LSVVKQKHKYNFCKDSSFMLQVTVTAVFYILFISVAGQKAVNCTILIVFLLFLLLSGCVCFLAQSHTNFRSRPHKTNKHTCTHIRLPLGRQEAKVSDVFLLKFSEEPALAKFSQQPSVCIKVGANASRICGLAIAAKWPHANLMCERNEIALSFYSSLSPAQK